MKKIKSLAQLLNESNLPTDTSSQKLADGGSMDGVQFPSRLGTFRVEFSDITRLGLTLDVAFTGKGQELTDNSEIVRVSISPEGTVKVIDRSSGRVF